MALANLSTFSCILWVIKRSSRHSTDYSYPRYKLREEFEWNWVGRRPIGNVDQAMALRSENNV